VARHRLLHSINGSRSNAVRIVAAVSISA
jgi:hypothetical protein